MPAITVIVERLQFGENLIVSLGARHATIQLDDIEELAGERAAARILHADEEIVIELDQIITRHRALRDVGLEFLGDEHTLAFAAFPGGDEVHHDLLGLADHLEVRVRVKMRAGGDVRPTDTYRLAVQVSEIVQEVEIKLMVSHTADLHKIAPTRSVDRQ